MDFHIIIQLEWVSILLGIVSMPLNMYRRSSFWLVNIIISCLTLYTFYHRASYGRCMIGSIGIVMSCYGGYQWHYKKTRGGKKKRISRTSGGEWIRLLLVGVITLVFTYCMLRYFQSRLPLLDSIATIMVFCGMWLSAEKKLESPIYWGIYNLVSICHSYLLGSHYIFKYILYLFFAPYTYRVWKRAYDEQKEEKG